MWRPVAGALTTARQARMGTNRMTRAATNNLVRTPAQRHKVVARPPSDRRSVARPMRDPADSRGASTGARGHSSSRSDGASIIDSCVREYGGRRDHARSRGASRSAHSCRSRAPGTSLMFHVRRRDRARVRGTRCVTPPSISHAGRTNKSVRSKRRSHTDVAFAERRNRDRPMRDRARTRIHSGFRAQGDAIARWPRTCSGAWLPRFTETS